MAPIALLILLTISATAAPPDCGPAAGPPDPRLCHAALCTPTPGLPKNTDELIAEYQRHALTPRPSDQKAVEDYRRQMQGTRAQLEAQLASTAPRTIVSDLIANPVEGFENIQSLLGDIFYFELGGELYLNDMGETSANSVALAPVVVRWGKMIEAQSRMEAWSENGLEIDVEPGSDRFDDQLRLVDFAIQLASGDQTRLAELRRLRAVFVTGGTINKGDFDRNLSEKNFKPILQAYLRSHQGLVEVGLTEALDRERSRDWRSMVENKVFTCQLRHFMANRATQALTSARFQELKEKVVADFRSRMLPRFSAHTRAFIGPKVTTDLFSLIPLSATDEALGSVPAAGGSLPELFQTMQWENMRGCKATGDVGDHFNPNTNQVMITVASVQTGNEAMMAHELGHYISSLFAAPEVSADSRASFVRLRQCLNQMHGPAEPNGFSAKHEGDLPWSEEDFADWFAASTSASPRGIGCDVIALTRQGDAARNAVESIHHEHSPDLFREIHYRQVQGAPVPQVCRDLFQDSPTLTPACQW